MIPIERAARAMYDNVQPDWDWNDPDAALMRRMYRDNVIAVLRAIREPDEAMKLAGARITSHISYEESDVAFQSDAANVWRLMIDAMVAEQ